MFTEPPSRRAKFIDWPLPHCALWQYDAVLNEQGERIDVSKTCGFSANFGAILSLAAVDRAYSWPRARVTVL